MNALKRSVFVGCLLAALLLVSVDVQAQIINFEVTVTLNYEEVGADGHSEQKTEIVPSGMRISTFGVEGSARIAATRYNKEYLNIQKGEGDCYDQKRVVDGRASNLRGDFRGYAVLQINYAQLDTAIMFPMRPHYDEASNTVYYKTVVSAGKVLKTIVSRGRQKIKGDNQGTLRAYGNKVVLRGQVRVDSVYARDDARFVAVPRLVELNGDGPGRDKVVNYLEPMVFDGKDYEKTQYRRMGYDLENDRLNDYKINRNQRIIRTEAYHNGFKGQEAAYMQTGENYLFTYQVTFGPIDRTKKYNARLHRWYEDYNKVYRSEPDYLLWDGNLQDPMLFLDWSSARSFLELDPQPYRKEELSELSRTNKSVKLDFETGKVTLNRRDSLTQAELSSLQEMLHNWYTDPTADVRDVYVKGYASPEGRYSVNKELAADRTQTLTNILREQRGANEVKAWHHDSEVVGWDVVADSLEQRIGTPEALNIAREIREITVSVKDRDRQSRLIQAAPYYEYLRDNVLGMLRHVDITINYIAIRILTPAEIFEKYRNDSPKGYRQGIGVKNYEYYHLMNRLYELGRWDELYTMAKAAYKNLDVVGEQATRARRRVNPDATSEDDKYYIEEDRNNPYRRPYSLAAYYLSLCKLRKGEVDTLLLADYLDEHRQRIEKDPNLGQGYGIWNDPAFVVNHILMHCYARNFSRAEYYALNWLPEDPNDPHYETYRNLAMFVSCLNGHDNDPQVQEYIKSTSPMNHAVIAASQDTEAGYREALEVLDDATQVDYKDPKVHYLKAICRFRLNPFKSYEHPAYPSYNIYDRDGDEDFGRRDFAAPMLEALRLNPDYMKQLEVDGYFNDAYRRMVKYFWHRLQQGADLDTIADEYDALRQKFASANGDK